MTPWRVWLAALALSLSGCTVDGLFFNPTPVDDYDFDSGDDPSLDGELTPLHPSLIDAAHRREGFVETDDGAIHWVFAQRDGASDAILFSHGNTGNIGLYWDRVERLWELGFHVLVYDYPGYGRSEGTPSERGVFDAGQAALEQLAAQPEVRRIWLYGYSLGGAPTFELAARSERGEAPVVAGVMTEAAWCSAEDVLQDGALVNVPGHFATDLEMDSCARAAELTETPLFLVHGSEDSVIHVRHMALLQRAATGVTVRSEHVDGAGHTDVPLRAADYDAWVQGFLR
ncbi:MAG: alpha/beta hydrolase [Sandaracinaceae bacterium]